MTAGWMDWNVKRWLSFIQVKLYFKMDSKGWEVEQWPRIQDPLERRLLVQTGEECPQPCWEGTGRKAYSQVGLSGPQEDSHPPGSHPRHLWEGSGHEECGSSLQRLTQGMYFFLKNHSIKTVSREVSALYISEERTIPHKKLSNLLEAIESDSLSSCLSSLFWGILHNG